MYRDGDVVHPLLFYAGVHRKSTGMSIQVFQAQAGAFSTCLGRSLSSSVGGCSTPVTIVALWALSITQEPGWAIATYSRGLMMFSQGLFYLMVIALHRSFRTRLAGMAGVGAGAGVLSCTCRTCHDVVGTVVPSDHEMSLHGVRGCPAVLAHLKCSVLGAAFIIITLPLTWYVVRHYGLDQVNRIPTAYTTRRFAIGTCPVPQCLRST